MQKVSPQPKRQAQPPGFVAGSSWKTRRCQPSSVIWRLFGVVTVKFMKCLSAMLCAVEGCAIGLMTEMGHPPARAGKPSPEMPSGRAVTFVARQI